MSDAKPGMLPRSLVNTAVATVCALVLVSCVWVSFAGARTVSLKEVVVSAVLLGSLIFPAVYVAERFRIQNKQLSSQATLILSILWMMVSVIGLAVTMWSAVGKDALSPFAFLGSFQFWFKIIIFGGMFVSSLFQLAQAADRRITELGTKELHLK
jgi:hypothetical protein